MDVRLLAVVLLMCLIGCGREDSSRTSIFPSAAADSQPTGPSWDNPNTLWGGASLAIDPKCANHPQLAGWVEYLERQGAMIWRGAGSPMLILSCRGEKVELKSPKGETVLYGTDVSDAMERITSQIQPKVGQNYTENDIEVTAANFRDVVHGEELPLRPRIMAELMATGRIRTKLPSLARELIPTVSRGGNSLAETRHVMVNILTRWLNWDLLWNEAHPWERLEYLRLTSQLPKGTYVLGIQVADASGNLPKISGDGSESPTAYIRIYPEETDGDSAYDIPEKKRCNYSIKNFRRSWVTFLNT